MTTPPATSKIPPGRPETLTTEQEAKLKQLWCACLKVFGVLEPSESVPASDATTPDDHSTATTEGSSTPKKKSLGRLLGRSKKDKEPKGKEKEVATPAVSVAVDDSDDKYGHNKEFQAVLASQTPAELRGAFWDMVKCDNPDGFLLRFLRARKWDVDKALVMLVATMGWRAKEMDVAGVVRSGETGAITEKDEGFMLQLRLGKSFLHGVDKDGRPICFVRVRLHKQADQSEKSLERYTIYIMETARLMLRSPVDTACVVFDMTNFSLANMDYTPVKFMIKCFEAHYPESLGICLVHKAPWVFQGIWSIIKGWLDPVVASKINFTKTTEELEQFIPRSQIIKELGGDEDWEYNYIEPTESEDAALNDTARLRSLQTERDGVVKQYEELTKAWIAADGEASAERKSRRNELAKKLEIGYWAMDKHLRGRTFYDRTGVLGADGSVNFYPAKREQATADNSDID
ncbi:CRAL-TRIO domain-containing protein [Sphaerosporella brunnea]|uniref:CRAL-TRIO domain-containing protein n=1 Tax=Sphaerosporella brunnea TaxID=1250544 RepID=A0A5J5EGV3_9PEZI|nr:CRAL-TRIO domain-containing protein [Sphaerosporella brunnea]